MAAEYTTIQGDMWDGIAKRTLGSEKYMVTLMEANPDFMATVIFSAGTVLTIPEVAAETTTNLPPWKRKEGS